MALDLLGEPIKSRRAMGSHQSARALAEVWLTPPEVLLALGGWESFDLDPCAVMEPRPWPTAKQHFTLADNGLQQPWHGRVFLNPPYGAEAARWMLRLADHGNGCALIFARTETEMFVEAVWKRATALRFLFGRLYFHRPDGRRADANAGAPSVLVAYGEAEALRLKDCALPGQWVRL